MTKTELFINLAKPDENGFSRWVSVDEFVGIYKELQLGNGGSWCRASSTLARKYNVEFDKSISKGNAIDRIRLSGFNAKTIFNQNIRKDIKDYYKNQKCVMLGINGNSENTKIEIDHKDGRKNDLRVSDIKTQILKDFQPLCKAANDAKRQICKVCKETNKRWSAKNIKGNPYDFYKGDENYTDELGCVGCYQYDPVEYRLESVKKISQEASKAASEFIFNKLYKDDDL
ncbi:restriction endonuclease [Campylobacter canadensis]|uniref:restriction endonuclease n=1 Tax=Campylobacter canadensis TaxID=449520 RepID=UPI001552AFA6|nr:restriction endonuclease [Campylobacter canadensis]MBZ7994978.1 restriction endonuclease [Campylobacter canadensis]MBZ7996872.1 restriction endonuclease [Campylobacter canadensis]MBZ8000351.1 restriction endonuclease [Campylobacter canadensis]MBZ8002152.1 restriction endonuclease [Campylobacter canadensis]MBZ8003137.1 restriction endonuclease [Campylobacter canadensis]